MNRVKNVVEGATTYGQEQYADAAIRKGWEAVIEYAKDYADQAMNIVDFSDEEACIAGLEIICARADLDATAEPTSRCLSGSNDRWAAEEWKQDGLIGHDLRVSIYYLFSSDDITDDDGNPLEAENYPWDGAHVSRIEVLEQGDLLRSHKSIPDDYAWHNGGLYHRGGDTLLPHHSGNWAWLENCDESEAAERAAEWEAQK